MRAIIDITAIRGAITVEHDNEEEITAATKELMNEIARKNDLDNPEKKIISILISTTPDLTSKYPAAVLRAMGYNDAALFSSLEPPIKNSLPMCIRLMVNVASYAGMLEPNHVYLKKAQTLRPDLVRYSIAIDGPSGAGKSTIATMLANRLGILHLDTGAMYRAVGLKILRLGIDFSDEKAVDEVLQKTHIDIEFENGVQNVLLDGENVNIQIRVHEVSQAAAKVSTLRCVRTALVHAQRKIAKKYNMVIDGRDIGTCVLPDAKYKFFLTANDEVRAKRRYEELKNAGQKIDFETVLQDIKKRDIMDTTREISPLRQAEDAILIDSSNMTPSEVVEKMLDYIKEHL